MIPENQPNFSPGEDESPAYLLGEWMRLNYHIEDQGQWIYTVASMPDDLSNRIVLTDTSPVLQVRGMRTRRSAYRSGIQIRLRAESYLVGYRKIKALMIALEELYHESVQIEAELYQIKSVRQTSGIFSLGKDERDRWNFSFNVTVCLSN